MRKTIFSALLLGAMVASTGALADPPAHAGGKGKGGPPAHAGKGHPGHGVRDHDGRGNERGDDRDDWRGGDAITIRFGAKDRRIIRDYYSDIRHCPPGLAKKNNGCLPPGQAKKWRIGHRLPGDLTWHDLPRDLVMRLSPSSAGYEYVRVGADILKIAVGTGLVVDAIQDLGRM